MTYRFLFLLALVVLTLTSCNFSEDIYINEDGSGKLSFKFDGSQMMAMVGEEIAEGEETKLDTIMNFKDFLEEKKDSIATLSEAEQERLKQLEAFSMRMSMDSEKQELLMDMYTDFASVAELDNMMASFSKMGGSTGAGLGGQSAPELGEGTVTEYSFDGTTFRRKGFVNNQEIYQQALDSLGKMEMFLSSSKYTLNYHFPRPVASVDREDVLYSEDRKSITVESAFMELMKKPELLNIAVTLEE